MFLLVCQQTCVLLHARHLFEVSVNLFLFLFKLKLPNANRKSGFASTEEHI